MGWITSIDQPLVISSANVAVILSGPVSTITTMIHALISVDYPRSRVIRYSQATRAISAYSHREHTLPACLQCPKCFSWIHPYSLEQSAWSILPLQAGSSFISKRPYNDETLRPYHSKCRIFLLPNKIRIFSSCQKSVDLCCSSNSRFGFDIQLRSWGNKSIGGNGEQKH